MKINWQAIAVEAGDFLKYSTTVNEIGRVAGANLPCKYDDYPNPSITSSRAQLIKGFFENVDHDWLEQMLRQRVDDSAFIALIRKWLKAGVLEEAGQVIHPATGTPQGGIISPVLANIYLHCALDLWVEKVVPKGLKGAHVYMRYADDFVVGFEYGGDAERFFEELPVRLEKFGLSMAMDKSAILRFSRCDLKGSRCFTFLGFEFYWARTRKGNTTVKRRTSKKKFRASLAGLKEWVRNNRSRPLKELAATLRRKFTGYFNYYGVIGNSDRLSKPNRIYLLRKES